MCFLDLKTGLQTIIIMIEACKFHYVVPSFFGQAKFIELGKMKEKKRLQASNGVLCLKRILALGVEERKHMKSRLNF